MLNAGKSSWISTDFRLCLSLAVVASDEVLVPFIFSSFRGVNVLLIAEGTEWIAEGVSINKNRLVPMRRLRRIDMANDLYIPAPIMSQSASTSKSSLTLAILNDRGSHFFNISE